MEIPIHGKDGLYIETRLRLLEAKRTGSIPSRHWTVIAQTSNMLQGACLTSTPDRRMIDSIMAWYWTHLGPRWLKVADVGSSSCRHWAYVWHDDVIKWKHIFRVTGHLCGEFTGDRWILRSKVSDVELRYFLWSALNTRLSKQWWGWWFETPSRPLWRHCNGKISMILWIKETK